jgi:hypothetical protein
LIIEAIINRDSIYLRSRVHRSNSNRQENHMTTKFISSVHLRCRLFSDRNNLREQLRSHCSDQEFSVSRSNQAHRHSNSLHQRESDRRINRFSLHTHETDDNRWFNKIINQKQIRSVSNRFKDKIRLITSSQIESRRIESSRVESNRVTWSRQAVRAYFNNHIISLYIIFDHCWVSFSRARNE